MASSFPDFAASGSADGGSPESSASRRRCSECDGRMCFMRCDENPGVGVCDAGACDSPVNLAVGQRVCTRCCDDAVL